MNLDDALGTAGIGVTVLSILAWLSRAGGMAPVAPGELRYSRMLRWLALLVTILPPMGVVAICLLWLRSHPALDRGDRIAFFSLLFFFPALGLPLVIEFFRVRHTFDDRGLHFRSPWSPERHLAWNEITSLKWRPMIKWLDVQTITGTKAHLSPWLSGTRAFAEAAIARLPRIVLDGHPNERAVIHLMLVGRTTALLLENLPPAEILAAVNAGKRRI
jgi:hypothetical protein